MVPAGVLAARAGEVAVGRRLLGAGHGRVDGRDREEVEVVDAGPRARDWVMNAPIRYIADLVLHHRRDGLLPGVRRACSGRSTGCSAGVLVHHRADLGAVERVLAGQQLAVERRAVDPQVEVVEPARGHPRRRPGAVGQRVDALALERRRTAHELVPGRRRLDAPLLERRLLVEHAPPVVVGRDEDLLAVGVAATGSSAPARTWRTRRRRSTGPRRPAAGPCWRSRGRPSRRTSSSTSGGLPEVR